MRFKFIHLEQTAFSNVSGNLHIKWRGKAISYANVCMIPYFVIGGPYVAGWGCAGEESRRSCNMFDKHSGMLRPKTHICTCPHAHRHTVGSHTSLLSINLPLSLPRLTYTLSLSHIFSASPTRCFHISPSRPIPGNNFSPRNKCGTLIKVLISDPAAFRNITLSLCTVTVIDMI